MSNFVNDANVGSGYGSIITKFAKDTKAGQLFPYNNVQNSEEDEEIDDDPMRIDVSNKINYSNFSCAPSNNRTDRDTLGTKGLAERVLDDQTDRRTLTGMVPFPLRGFSGPPIGGGAGGKLITMAPGRIGGSPYGWTRGAMTKIDDGPIAPARFMDAIDPEILQRTKMKLKLRRLE